MQMAILQKKQCLCFSVPLENMQAFSLSLISMLITLDGDSDITIYKLCFV